MAAQISAERVVGRVLGPLPAHLASLTQTSPIGLIPKPHQPGKRRLVVDLSSPPGYSVNDAIPLDICHMCYASVADAARLIRQLGAGTQLAKVDLQNAYWLVPVHLDDHQLQGLRWDKEMYIDTVLPFGFRLAPKFYQLWSMPFLGYCWL